MTKPPTKYTSHTKPSTRRVKAQNGSIKTVNVKSHTNKLHRGPGLGPKKA